jgi:uncharacterized protein with PIN domain
MNVLIGYIAKSESLNQRRRIRLKGLEREGKMEKSITVKPIFEENDERLKQIYVKVVEKPNQSCIKKSLIKCPECSAEILMIPSLRAMNEAIENHVKIHKELMKTNPLMMHSKSINIRLDLAQQVLLQALSAFQ